MSFYIYKAVDKKGKEHTGNTVALDQAEVLRDIKSKDLFPVEVKEVTEADFYREKPKQQQKKKRNIHIGSKKIKTKDLIFILRDLASLVGAGVVINRALAIMSDQSHGGGIKDLLEALQEIVSQGEPLSEAVKKFPGYFPTLVPEMVAIGERSGRMEEILNRLAIFYERQDEMQSRFKQAMTYPIVIFSIALLSIFIFMTIALPRLMKIFDGLGTELPPITLFMVGMSNFLRQYWPFLFATIFAISYFLRYMMKYPFYKEAVIKLFMKVPVIGPLYAKVVVSRLLRALSAMYKSGIPLLVIFQMLPQVIQNLLYEQAMARIEARVRRGESLSNSFLQEPIFPKVVPNIIFVGEESGTMEQNLERIAARFEDEVDRTTKILGTLIEPFFIVFMGGFVLFIALALFMPLVKLVTTLSAE